MFKRYAELFKRLVRRIKEIVTADPVDVTPVDEEPLVTIDTVTEHTQVEPTSDEKITRPALQSRRAEDMSAEGQLAIFMDKYLYERFPTKDFFASIRRVSTKQEQLSGIDVEMVDKKGRVFYVDEKAQLYYLNKDLPTFAFELQYLRAGHETLGWLCNDTLKTDFYMLIWPYATQDTCRGITWDKFTKVECLLIRKKKLIDMLGHEGLTIDKLQADARGIRTVKETGRIKIEGLDGIYYFASDPQKYREEPINIIISKTRLRQVAERTYVVTPEGVTCE